MNFKLLKEIDEKADLLIVENKVGAYEDYIAEHGLDIEHPLQQRVIEEYRQQLMLEIGGRDEYAQHRALGAAGEAEPGAAARYQDTDLSQASTTKGAGIGLNPSQKRAPSGKEIENGLALVLSGDDTLQITRIEPNGAVFGKSGPRGYEQDVQVTVDQLEGPTPMAGTKFMVWNADPKKIPAR